MKSTVLPHPFPYQGSKRRLARQILQRMPDRVRTLYEPFAGSAAVSIAAAARERADSFVIADIDGPLIALWQAILERPAELCDEYQRLWEAQAGREAAFYVEVRARFNERRRSSDLLFLLARCVKSAVRYNAVGAFNNSPDNRRKGMRPATMRANILGVASLLRGRASAVAKDYREVLASAGPDDLVYLDPPYQGVSRARDPRYIRGLDREAFVQTLEVLNARRVPFLISYDGRTGDKTYGEELPLRLRLHRVELLAGRSTQATLLGRAVETHESLYVSESLACQSVVVTATSSHSENNV